jgi:hypothetical protein
MHDGILLGRRRVVTVPPGADVIAQLPEEVRQMVEQSWAGEEPGGPPQARDFAFPSGHDVAVPVPQEVTEAARLVSANRFFHGYIQKCGRAHCGLRSQVRRAESGRCRCVECACGQRPSPGRSASTTFATRRRHCCSRKASRSRPCSGSCGTRTRGLTTEIYGHLDVEDMRAGLDRLRIDTPTTAPSDAIAVVQNCSNIAPIFRRNGAPVVRGNASSAIGGETAPPKPKQNRDLNWSGRQDSNLRPPGPEPGALPG